MSNMNEGAKTDKTPTLAERQHSSCTKKKMRNPLPRGFWEGMNDRDETSPVTHRPVGRGISEGFAMTDDNFDGEIL